jgi:hypothetical protein
MGADDREPSSSVIAGEGHVHLAAHGEPAPGSSSSASRAYRCLVESSTQRKEELQASVIAAVENLDGVGVETNSRSEVLEMIVVKPLEWLEIESESPSA